MITKELLKNFEERFKNDKSEYSCCKCDSQRAE